MIFKKTKSLDQLIKSAQKHHKNGNYKKALTTYKEALTLDPDNASLYDCLIETHSLIEENWSEDDLSESLYWTMKKQELENPALKRVHAQMEPHWQPIADLIKKMMATQDDMLETQLIEQIAAHQNKSIYPLIEALLGFKKLAQALKRPASNS